MPIPLHLKINGKRYDLSVERDGPLLWILRDELGLTGTKYGCGEGQCGACTVLLDGEAVRSCLTPASGAAGKEITTIEGLGKNGRLHPVQQAFLDLGAFQCGYCTPGMILSAVAFLHKNSSPSEEEIKRGLEGNLCRCCVHPLIIEAVRLAARSAPFRG